MRFYLTCLLLVWQLTKAEIRDHRLLSTLPIPAPLVGVHIWKKFQNSHMWNFMLSRDRLIHWSCHVCLLQLIIININNHMINLCVCVSIDACIERTYKCFSLTDLNNSFIFHIAHNVLMSKFTWILILKIHLTWEILTGVKSVTTCPSISTMLFIDLCYAMQENSVLLFYANILIFLPTPVFIWSIWAWMCCFSLFHIMQQSVSIYTCL